VPCDLIEEVVDFDALAEEPPLHVGEGGDDRVDRPRLTLLAEILQGEHSPGATGATGTRGGFLAVVP
jgi:hypothetical protein